MKILIVDDQATVRTAMRSVLTKLGFNSIIQADDGDTALEQLKKDKDIGLIIRICTCRRYPASNFWKP